MTNDDQILDTFPLKDRDALETRFEGEVLLYAPSTQEAVLLNTAAIAIWDRCDGGTSLDALIGDDPHVPQIIAGLARRGLLRGISERVLEAQLSRRGFLRATAAVAVGAGAVPMLQSAPLPAALAASSGMPHGGSQPPKTQHPVGGTPPEQTTGVRTGQPANSTGIVSLPTTGGNAISATQTDPYG